MGQKRGTSNTRLVVLLPAPPDSRHLHVHLPYASPDTITTPAGTVQVFATATLSLFAPAPTRALIAGAKELGAERVIEPVPLTPVNHLLAPGDLLVPDHLLDLTTGQVETFFVGKGYGFVPQHPPYCPELRAALLEAARAVVADIPGAERPCVFGRGTYGAYTAPVTDTMRRTLAHWQVDAAGTGGVPASFLARELELCYAIVGVVAPLAPVVPGDDSLMTAWHTLFRAVQHAGEIVPGTRLCPCPDLMRPTRERGLIGDDWHTWVGDWSDQNNK